MKKILLMILLLAFQLSARTKGQKDAIRDFDFVNRGTNSVSITVPYFDGTNKFPRTIELLLNPGDAYFKGNPEKRINGTLHSKYGLMPNLVTNLMAQYQDRYSKARGNYNMISNRIAKLNLQRSRGCFSEEWLEEKIADFHGYKEYFSRITNNLALMKGKNNPYDFSKVDFGKSKYETLSFHVFAFSSITNVSESALTTLENFEADSDGDGLTNLEEFELDTNPLDRDYVAFSTRYLEIPLKGCGVMTNEFQVRSLSSCPLKCGFFIRKYDDFIWKPRLVALDGKDFSCDDGENPNYVFSINAKDTRRFALLTDADKMPASMPIDSEIKLLLVSKDNRKVNCNYRTMECYTPPGRKPVVLPPVLESPKKGEAFCAPYDCYLLWKDPEIGPNLNDDGSYNYSVNLGPNHAYSVQLYKLLPNGTGRTIRFDATTVCLSEHHEENKTPDGKYTKGLYFWRIVKDNSMEYTVVSDWSWFSVGEEIRPDMAFATDGKTTGPSQP